MKKTNKIEITLALSSITLTIGAVIYNTIVYGTQAIHW